MYRSLWIQNNYILLFLGYFPILMSMMFISLTNANVLILIGHV